MKNKLFFLILTALLVASTLAGCAGTRPPRPRVLIPPPPNTSRLEWLGTYYSQNDFAQTKKEKALEGLLGEARAQYLGHPFGIASDGHGLVYVSDATKKNVFIFDFNRRKVSMLAKAATFSLPLGMAVDKEGNLYVVDAGAQHVLVFSPDHHPLRSIGSSKDFINPAYVAVNDRLNRVYVSDGKGQKIVVFNKQGKKLFTFGHLGTGKGELYGPQGIALAKNNDVYVADMLNARIDVFTADGKYLRAFGKRGDAQWNFEMPKDLAFDAEGHLYIIDSRKAAMMIYRPDGRLLLYISSGKSTFPLAMALPGAISIDANDTIYVTDQINRRFLVWQYLNTKYLAAHPITVQEKKAIEERVQKLKNKNH